MRTFGVDVHKRFLEVSVYEGGRTGRIGRVAMADREALADSLVPDDHVVIESTSVSGAVVDVLGRRAGRVTVSNPMKTKAIASAKVKTDKVDARVLAELGASGFVSEVWVPDAQVRSLRRRVAHRARLVRQRTRLRNQVHAVLTRNLLGVRATDAFGKRGRAELAAAALPEHERYELDSALRLHDALEAELAVLDGRLCAEALEHVEARRLMTIPGVGAVTALGLVALIGDVSRFATPRHLVGYLGLDPRVRQSGERAHRTGHISRQGQAHARSLLVEASLGVVKVPGPLRAFHARVRARRGSQIASVATARKLATLIWCSPSSRAARARRRRPVARRRPLATSTRGTASATCWPSSRAARAGGGGLPRGDCGGR